MPSRLSARREKTSDAMLGRRYQLFRFSGIPIRVDLSWFLVATLVTWSLTGYFDQRLPELSPWIHGTMGLAGALGLFVSVLLHELAHAVVARRYGMPIRGITLFVFGGVAEMETEPPGPAAEFGVAIAGPIASFAVAVACLSLWAGGGSSGPWSTPTVAVAGYLTGVNTLLAVFNLVPAFPLDGGRVLRSVLWQWRGDLHWATRFCSRLGITFGLAMILLGTLRLLDPQSRMGGLWMIFIGLFLRWAAKASYHHLLVRSGLEGEPVSRFMRREPVTVPRFLSVANLVDDYVRRYQHRVFPVVDNERLIGSVSTARVQQLPREEWTRQSVGALVEPLTLDNTVAPDTDALEALTRMSRSRLPLLMVVDKGKLVGVLGFGDFDRGLAAAIAAAPGGAAAGTSPDS